MGMLRHHAHELLTVALGHPVFRLDRLAAGDPCLELGVPCRILGLPRGLGFWRLCVHSLNLLGGYFPRMSSQDPRAEGQVTVDVAGAVATVKFSHPKSNSLPAALLRKLAHELRNLSSA